jgi:S1-C subfamily serine protease
MAGPGEYYSLGHHTHLVCLTITNLQMILYKTSKSVPDSDQVGRRARRSREPKVERSRRSLHGILNRQYAALAFIVVFSLRGNALPPQAQNAHEIAQKAFPSVVMLVMDDKNGNPLTLGSGFFVRDGVIATNMHVIEGAEGGHAKLIDQKTEFNIRGIVGRDAAHDLVLLAVDDAKSPALALGQSAEVGVGDEVYAVGNPLGLEGTLSPGIVSGVRKIGPDTLLQITAPISPGSSGGPVLNSRGVVIGITVATFEGGQNLNFAIPVMYLTSLLSHASPMVALRAAPRTTQGKSFVQGIGRHDSTAVVGSQFAWKATDLLVFYGDFSFSLQNKLREPVSQVNYLVVFYDRSGKPIETYKGIWTEDIAPGLAKRETGSVDESVRPLMARVEIRVLDFKLASENAKTVEIPQPPQPPIRKIEQDLTNIPKYWTNVKSGDIETVRIENEYLYEEGTSQGDGTYINEVKYICETKRQGNQWVGKCHNRYLLHWGSLGSQIWCPLDLDEVVTSVSPSRIEGDGEYFSYPSSVNLCPLPSSQRLHWTLIPKN